MRTIDVSQPPDDIELKNIIDKLAQFVARNGPEFEQMTKRKQRGNKKFQFLYGGEYYTYYKYKLQQEQAITQQQQEAQLINQMYVNNQILKQEIRQSEQNLNSQHNVLLEQQQADIEATIAKCQKKDLENASNECGIKVSEIVSILQPIINNCTKDSIGRGKSWFLQHADTKQKAVFTVHFLLHKVLQSSTFPEKLHVIYLVNDLLHHSVRKKASELKEQLELAVVPMICNASLNAKEDQMQKLNKLVKIWESKTNYLKPDTLVKLRNPIISYQQYQSEQMTKYAAEIAALTNQTAQTFEGYQSQHHAFVSHTMQQIANLELQIENIEHQTVNMSIPPPSFEPMGASSQQLIQTFQPPILGNEVCSSFLPNLNIPPPNITIHSNNQVSAQFDIQHSPSIEIKNDFSEAPLNFLPPPGMLPDVSKPPPGFLETEVHELIPTAPYYELPAGLMVPLVKLEDFEYKPLDPKDIRLPPPAPPDERLLTAVDAFYSLPSHESPRDSEGWEKLGLYEYYKAKNEARRKKEDAIKEGLRIKSRSPSPIIMTTLKYEAPKRRYRSKTPTPPPMLYGRNEKSGRRLRSRSRSRDRSRSDSPKIRRSRKNSRCVRDSRKRRYSKSRSRSRTPSRMSLSPERQTAESISFSKSNTELDASNKGHEILKKMGWGGHGLGAKEQGIDSPISGGDVRDRQDQYKGIGCNINDPYENFRKSKGVAFISRMKARDKEKETVAVGDRL
ncbi:calcium homeostasis endoplasmic reticulum protein-like isoform X2 [Anthonomus grandis grandis]|uniref:calcium homeostasis endoplasmic reticulum protein-like isoform X2 n=1 Tax=Anthonomus grandis grandis TaxID=2921223 RepID=UPI002165C6BB|nr:calcium homeostasis endoplasmic reticulum protein-like isoform X2 [Anthonomus grandis grandis]